MLRRSPLVALFVFACLDSIEAQTLRPIDVPSMAHRRMDFDPARGTLVLVGPDGTHELRQGTWQRLPGQPPQVMFGAFAADAGRAWLAMQPTSQQPRLWHGDPLQWAEIAVASAFTLPSPSFSAFDANRGELVTFGGFDASGPVLGWTFDQTWVFDGTAWVRRLPTTSPPAFGYGGMVYDELRQRIVLAKGLLQGTLQTWEWNGLDWQSINTTTAPPTRQAASLAFDRGRGRIVLVGGNLAGGAPDCWEYDGAAWQQVAPMPGPARQNAAIAYDPIQGRILVLGGHDGTFELQDAWYWDGTTWTAGPAFGPAPTATLGGAVAVEPGGTGVLYYGGGSLAAWPTYRDETWRWNGSWTRLQVTGPALAMTWPPAPGSGMAGALLWSQQNQMHLLFGYTQTQQPPSVPVLGWPHGMSTWNGGAWSSFAGAVPPLRRGAAIAVDTVRNEAVLFGGEAATGGLLDDTWVFDGSQWLLRAPAVRPSARAGHALAYDAIRNRVVLHGGWNSSAQLAETWEWNGATWAQVATVHTPPFGDITFDPGQQRIVLLAAPLQNGIALPAGAAAAWTYDGVDWSPMADTGPALGGTPLGVVGTGLIVAETGRLAVFRTADARVQAFGSACSADAALLTTNRLPLLGALDFAVEITHAPANGIALLAGAAGVLTVPVAVLGCTLLVDPTQVVVGLATDPIGRADAPLPVPNSGALLGAEFGFQAATLAPLAPQGLALTRGVRARLGY